MQILYNGSMKSILRKPTLYKYEQQRHRSVPQPHRLISAGRFSPILVQPGWKLYGWFSQDEADYVFFPLQPYTIHSLFDDYKQRTNLERDIPRDLSEVNTQQPEVGYLMIFDN